ncbi:hypothetical protein ACFL5Z_11305 [Planctomycetota bacterium]
MTGIYTVVASDGYSDVDSGAYGLAVNVIPPIDPHGLYPYDPLPPDGNSVSLSNWNTLSWWPVDTAAGYDVYFSGSSCMPLEMIAENIENPYMPMPAVEGEQVCTWRVVAHTPSGDITGPTWWFVVEQCPYSLNISAIGQGSIEEPSAGFHEYSYGQFVLVTAVADPDFEFVRWEGSAVDANKVIPVYKDLVEVNPAKILLPTQGSRVFETKVNLANCNRPFIVRCR